MSCRKNDFHPNQYLESGIDPDEQVIKLLEDLKTGKLGISDLMGPLYGKSNLTSTSRGKYERTGEQEGYATIPEESLSFYPDDDHNRHLLSNVHPPDYNNPNPSEYYDLVVIGAGVAGLLSVITAKWLGKRCALIESNAMGGDCLNIGCVPSKALIASAKVLHDIRNCSQFGVIIPQDQVSIDFPSVMERMRKIRSDISPHDSVQRYTREFCEHIYIGKGSFHHDPNTIVVVGDDGTERVLHYSKAMIATGASASIPRILTDIPHLTNKNFFNLVELPPRMVVIGCGPVSLELSQALAIFGCEVTCLERSAHILSREDEETSNLMTQILSEQKGLSILTNTIVTTITIDDPSNSNLFSSPWPVYHISIINTVTKVEQVITCEAVLNATGRSPNISHLNLDQMKVNYDSNQGVEINDFFQTTNPNIYASGDCVAGSHKFTHSADFQARLAVRNMFLNDTNKYSDLLIPWCTYTIPEVAHVGKYEYELLRNGIEYESFTRQLAPVDRCRCDGVDKGFVKIMILKGTQDIIGCTIVGPSAGDMISEITVCMQYGIKISELAGVIHPYPTVQEAIRQCALQYYHHYKDPNGIALRTLKRYMREIEEERTSEILK